jgi:hypothetical protein
MEGQHRKWKPTGKECQFKDIIMPVVVCMLWVRDDWVMGEFEDWAREGGIDVTKREEVFQWLGQKIVWGGIEVSRLVQLFYRFEKRRDDRRAV